MIINRIFFAVIGLFFVLLVFIRVKKKKFSEKESFFWMVISIFMLTIAIFPDIIIWLTDLVGIDYAPSLLFLLAIMFIIVILFRLTEQVSILQEHLKELAQNHAVLEERLRQAESILRTGNEDV